MDGDTFFLGIVYGGLALFAVYLVARLCTTAYFNSKRDYEKRKINGPT